MFVCFLTLNTCCYISFLSLQVQKYAASSFVQSHCWIFTCSKLITWPRTLRPVNARRSDTFGVKLLVWSTVFHFTTEVLCISRCNKKKKKKKKQLTSRESKENKSVKFWQWNFLFSFYCYYYFFIGWDTSKFWNTSPNGKDVLRILRLSPQELLR